MQLQSNIRQMVPSFSNTSGSFPMINELQHLVSEFFKVDCQDVFFDVLSLELNLEGVIYFFQNIIIPQQEALQKHFEPAEQALKKVSMCDTLEGPVYSVLKKTYQSNWQKIEQQALSESFHQRLMKKMQNTLCIADGLDEGINEQIVDFSKKCARVLVQINVSEPCLELELTQMGQKVAYNSFKHDSVDGFIKANEECLVVLPQVSKNGEMAIKAQVLPTSYEFP